MHVVLFVTALTLTGFCIAVVRCAARGAGYVGASRMTAAGTGTPVVATG